jgi:hypothetical protein
LIGAADDSFGNSVAIDGDTIVIGADRFYATTSIGRAYVYTRSDDVWTEQTILAASDGAPDDGFGISVAIDGGNIVVAALFTDNNGEDSGSAYVFAV